MVLFYETFVKEKLFSMVFGGGGCGDQSRRRQSIKGGLKRKLTAK